MVRRSNRPCARLPSQRRRKLEEGEPQLSELVSRHLRHVPLLSCPPNAIKSHLPTAFPPPTLSFSNSHIVLKSLPGFASPLLPLDPLTAARFKRERTMAPRLFSCFGRGAALLSSSAASRESNETVDLTVEEQRRMGPVLVELFSSQGCATSPEAEAVAARLAQGVLRGPEEEVPPVVVLDFHVEYWDYMGWKDPFGSNIWTVRQKAYIESLKLDTLYTPQVVVHGRSQCLGTDQDAIISAVRSATRCLSPTMQASFTKPSPDTLQVSLTGALQTKVDGRGADVLVALYENGLVTDCTRGENKGKVLANDHVVRRMEKLLSVKDTSAKKNLSGSVQFHLWEDFNPAKCGLVLFVQNPSLHTFGVQHFQIPDTV